MNKEIIKELDKILPVVERVHGDSHPELHDVKKLYEELKSNPTEEVFMQLRRITDNYTAPQDACPTYEKTYRYLKELDNK